MSVNKINYILQLADNALIIGHRLSEWCGHGPILEQDIAITNTALDHLGQARNFYQYAAEMINALPEAERQELFSSPALDKKGADFSEDDLAYLRDAWDFKNVLLTEQPNTDWAYTIVRSFFYDHFNELVYNFLIDYDNSNLKAIAEKSLKETQYHKRWSSEWVIRLGDGTPESHERIQKAVNDLWPYTGELFELSETEKKLAGESFVIDTDAMKKSWQKRIDEVLEEATLQLPPADAWMQGGGKNGIHSEHLGFILAEMQYMQRAYPGMEW